MGKTKMQYKKNKNTVPYKNLVSQRLDSNAKLERIKSIATIFSAIAIPIVLTVAGYFIQRQLADEGIKKDYVAIATGILKENPATQEPELRTWAITILDDNSPVPFSKKAKAGLLTGRPVVVAGLAWIGPPADCRIPPLKRDVVERFKKLAKAVKKLDHDQAIDRVLGFMDYVVKQEGDVLVTRAKYQCLLDWVNTTEKSDIDYRNSIGAPSSQSIIDDLNKEKAESALREKNKKD
jgi:hypothetical protein